MDRSPQYLNKKSMGACLQPHPYRNKKKKLEPTVNACYDVNC
jgi:hypothetical protein